MEEFGAEVVGVPRETFPGERRVAVTPAVVPAFLKAGLQVVVESGAGEAAGFRDQAYVEKGASIVPARQDVFAADVILQVRTVGANPEAGALDLDLVRPEQIVVGHAGPLSGSSLFGRFAERKALLFAMELIPRITRAQSMDALSSQATVAGYKAVLIAADALPKMFPMLTTAAGTIPPARVFVIGAGVAGLQAIATARRLGAVVEAYDVRPAVKEQVESLGAKFVKTQVGEEGEGEGQGGYAKAMDEEGQQREREILARVVMDNDVVITTAQVPGKKPPILVTADMVAGMAPGSVVVDLAAEQGGNCDLSRVDEVVVHGGVTVLGPSNLPSTLPREASQMYARNISAFVLYLIRDKKVRLDLEDELIRETLVSRGGEVVHPRVLQAMKGDA